MSFDKKVKTEIKRIFSFQPFQRCYYGLFSIDLNLYFSKNKANKNSPINKN